ncbi:MAG: penicillin-binding transpeptidase domain-containing protein, partial [Robiginitomaculum sp.]
VKTGELRALLSMPLYDANLFVSGLSHAQMNALRDDPRRPQFNKVLGGSYPPASTFKMIVAMAGLEAGLIDPAEKILCTGKVNVGNRNFHCWKRRGHGPMDMHNAIKQSCDIFFYEVSQRIGMEKIRNMGERLGLGAIYPLGVGGEARGILPDDAWKQKRLGDGWRTGDTLNASIGQGFVLATPLQLTVMAARLANGNHAVSPFLIIGEDAPKFEALDVNPDHLTLVKEAMHAVCEAVGGTAYRPNGMGIKGAHMAGKTGTGQVRGISTAERASGVLRGKALPWKYRDHSLFVGFAPYDNPRFAASAIVEHGGSGARKAATIVRAMLGEALRIDGYATPAEEAP